MMLTGVTFLVSMYRQNTFDEFTINFADGHMQSCDWQWHYSLLHPNNDTPCVEPLHDGSLSGCISCKSASGLLGVMTKAYSSYKSRKARDKKAENMLQYVVFKFGAHFFFVASPSQAGASECHNQFLLLVVTGGSNIDMVCMTRYYSTMVLYSMCVLEMIKMQSNMGQVRADAS